MIIQVLLLGCLVAAAFYTVRSRRSAMNRLVRRSGTIAVLLAGVLFVLFPSLLTNLAQLVGVGRGADLLLYVLCVASIFTAISIYARFNELEDRYVRLARSIALREHGGGDTCCSCLTRSESAD